MLVVRCRRLVGRVSPICDVLRQAQTVQLSLFVVVRPNNHHCRLVLVDRIAKKLLRLPNDCLIDKRYFLVVCVELLELGDHLLRQLMVNTLVYFLVKHLQDDYGIAVDDHFLKCPLHGSERLHVIAESNEIRFVITAESKLRVLHLKRDGLMVGVRKGVEGNAPLKR